MIKRGIRKALKKAGTVLLVEMEYGNYDDTGNYYHYLVGGDLLVLTGETWSYSIKTVNIATGQCFWMRRDWLLKHTSIAFDARVLDFAQDA